MKKTLLPLLLFAAFLFPPITFSAETPTPTQTPIPTPQYNNPYCDFSGGGVSGQPTGNVTITSSCVVYENVNGVSGGNLIINGGIITLHKQLGFAKTGEVQVENGGIIYVNTNGSIVQGLLCVKDADGDHYADTIAVTTDPYGVSLTTPITQIEQKIFDTETCPAGYTERTAINNLNLADTDFSVGSTADKTGTTDRELLRLGFNIGGITDALAAAGDVQIIDKNLLVCTGGACPTTTFASPTTGNVYTAGKVGIGKTTPVNPLDVTGIASFSDKVGIGTTNPFTNLEVLKPGTSLASPATTGTADASVVSRFHFGSIGLDLGTLTNGTSYLQNRLVTDLSSNYSLLLNPNGGNVGIGNTAPAMKLDVSGTIRAGNGTNFATNDGGLLLYSNNAYKIGFDANGGAPYAIRYNLDAADSVHGHIFSAGPIASPTNLMTIRGDGNVGIGKTNPAAKLDVTGTITASSSITTTGNVVINNGSPTIYFQDSDQRSAMLHNNSNLFYLLRGDGNNSLTWATYNGAWPFYVNLDNNNANFGGSITATSDIRLKTNIKPLPQNTLEKVQKLRGVYFNWKVEADMGKATQIGVIAQEVEKIFPELVATGADGYKTVAYDRLGPILIEAMKQQQTEIDSLKSEVTNLKKDIESIKQSLKTLK